ALFGLNILFYRKALQGLSLSTAYPVMLSGSLLLATLGARFVPVLNERISPVQVAGMFVVVAGVWMVTRS
ncbi:MAG: DMT family transporter, partial [Myxococcaceae bacterium]